MSNLTHEEKTRLFSLFINMKKDAVDDQSRTRNSDVLIVDGL
jgi:hypothetical protein